MLSASDQPPFNNVLVANRGEIACRVFATAKRLGMDALAVYSDADAEALHVRSADRAARIGPAEAAQSYLDVARVLAAADELGAEAIHPGYGFLSESAQFAAAVEDAGLRWVGPRPDSITVMGDKVAARATMAAVGVPLVPGTDALTDSAAALEAARDIGFPVLLKAAGGGGGIGMSIVRTEEELAQALETAQSRAERFFANSSVYLERYLERSRHVEVQILGLANGTIVALGERDCSVQRRHQKVLEETPSPGLTDDERARLLEAAQLAGQAIDYRGAGTVEFIMDMDDREFYFLEMNTRLQVEHPITELTTGLDLVECQLRIAAGEDISSLMSKVSSRGHAMEFRIYAEDSVRFLPRPGTIESWTPPTLNGVRLDSGYEAGDTVSQFYDPLVAKLCVHAADREKSLALLQSAAASFGIEGLVTNLDLVDRLCGAESFQNGTYDTGILEQTRPARTPR